MYPRGCRGVHGGARDAQRCCTWGCRVYTKGMQGCAKEVHGDAGGACGGCRVCIRVFRGVHGGARAAQGSAEVCIEGHGGNSLQRRCTGVQVVCMGGAQGDAGVCIRRYRGVHRV